ncbi:hypothetical protein [Catenulispora rubra]|uniref:hypothetical protein n=1 Tax=Catenulispora rubra TaxID=280293 RepID=UPI0018927CE3|nr:hypothetical protein [Catenulispora rubra]
MSADTLIAETEEATSWRRRLHPVAIQDFVTRLMYRDVFGVRVGVLVLIFPLFVASMAMSVTSRQGWNHPPDSRYYLTMMARDMGHSLPSSIKLEQQVSPGTHIAPWYFADNDPTWQLARTRILYPVLSIPFIWLWGLSGGSLMIPVLGDVLFLWAIARVLQRLYGPAVAVIVTGAFSLVNPIWGFSWAGTDTLAMGLTAVMVASFPIGRRAAPSHLAWIGLMALFIPLTRQVGVLAPAMAGAGWLWALARERTWRNRWLSTLVVTSAVTVATQVISMMLAKTDTGGVLSRGQTTTWGVIRQFVHFLKIVTQEACTYMWHSDRTLYALLIAAGITVVIRFKSDAAAVFFGAVCATYVITAGVGYSTLMRYEMIMFPAAAVAAGELVSLLVGDRATKASDPSEAPETPETTTPVTTPSRFGLIPALAATPPGRFLGLHLPRAERYRPQLLAGGALFAIVVGISIPGSWSSSIDAPASPSLAAAQGTQSYAVHPLAKPGAEVTLRTAFDQAFALAVDKGGLEGAFDWVHQIRYRPLAPDQLGWSQRDKKDGTYVLYPNSLGQDLTGMEAFGRAISLDRTVRDDTIKILTRQVNPYGEDVVFTVEDTSGHVHRGTASTVYPIWNKGDAGNLTSLIFDAS